MFDIKLNSQLFFVKFPIIFPLIYGIILFQFPNFETELIIITILILGETHFGATWPFFLDKINYPFIKKKKIELILLPLFIALLSIIGFIFTRNLFLLIFFITNMYHVTRQSFGVCKLYCKNPLELQFQKTIIYLINLIFFFIAFFRFYLPIIKSEHLLIINILILFFFFLISTYYFFKFKFSEKYLTLITGCIIFYPACFVANPIHIILMGVTMHYTQYLYLTNHIQRFRSKKTSSHLRKNFFSYNFLLIIIVYSCFMTLFSSMGKFDSSWLKDLIFIPILGQMLHFYLDSQLWKFNIKHNRDNVLKYLKF